MEGLDGGRSVPVRTNLNAASLRVDWGATFYLSAQRADAPGKGHDAFLVHEKFAGIADGATPLRPHRGAAVAAYASALLRGLHTFRDRPVRDALAAAICASRSKGSDPWDVPGATVAIARPVDGDIEVSVLCDCFAVVQQGDVFTVIEDTTLKAMDQAVIAEYAKKMDAGMSPEEAFDAMVPVMRANRARMNRPGGYWLASDDPSAAEHVVSMRFPAHTVDAVLLCSDGYSRLLGTFGLVSDGKDLLRLTAARGVEAMLTTLREYETATASMHRYPRIGIHDDATAVLITRHTSD